MSMIKLTIHIRASVLCFWINIRIKNRIITVPRSAHNCDSFIIIWKKNESRALIIIDNIKFKHKRWDDRSFDWNSEQIYKRVKVIEMKNFIRHSTRMSSWSQVHTSLTLARTNENVFRKVACNECRKQRCKVKKKTLHIIIHVLKFVIVRKRIYRKPMQKV